MKNFEYARATNLSHAIERGSDADSRFIAGGTLLVDLLRLQVERPSRVIDVNQLPWNEVDADGDGLRIGALVRNSDLAHHPLVTRDYPVLSQAILAGASPQIRNRATTAGNILQRTRCPYFRDVQVSACNKRNPGSGCAALQGYSRMHAILGGSNHCIAVHPSDMSVALAALDAAVVIQSQRGERSVPFTEFHKLPEGHPEIESVLQPGDVVTHVRLPKSNFARHSAYVKVRDRAAFAFALAAAAAALELQDNTIRDVRVALGGVATKPWRATAVEAALIGKQASPAAFQAAAQLAVNGAKPTAYNEFKLKMTQRVVVAALNRARSVA